MNLTGKEFTTFDEFTLSDLRSSLRRNWKLAVASVFSCVLVSGGLYSITDPKWNGYFSILLSDDSTSSSSSINTSGLNSALANIVGLSPGQEIESKIELLKSDSVLDPIYKNYIVLFKKLNPNAVPPSYRSWSGNISASQFKKTSIANITYTDFNKELVKPTLNILLSSIIEYSKKERMRSINDAISFAQDQADIYRERAEDSFRELYSFSLKYGISSSSTLPSQSLTNGIDISKLISGRPLALSTPSSGANNQATDPTRSAQLIDINRDLVKLREKFTDKDPFVIALKKDRDALLEFFKQSGNGRIAYGGNAKLSKEEAEDVLIKHDLLTRKASLDQSTLESMESSLLTLRLEQEKLIRPWKVVSRPFVNPLQESPIFWKYLLAGSLFGAFSGSLLSIIKDRISGVIYKSRSLHTVFEASIIEIPYYLPQSKTEQLFRLFLSRIPADSKSQFLALDGLNESLHSTLNSCFQDTTFTLTPLSEFIKLDKISSVYVLVDSRNTRLDQLEEVKRIIGITGSTVQGWIWIN